MATSNVAFRQKWRVGRIVEVKITGRVGRIRTVQGTGAKAIINVAVIGGVATNYRPADLIPL